MENRMSKEKTMHYKSIPCPLQKYIIGDRYKYSSDFVVATRVHYFIKIRLIISQSHLTSFFSLKEDILYKSWKSINDFKNAMVLGYMNVKYSMNIILKKRICGSVRDRFIRIVNPKMFHFLTINRSFS